MTDEKEIRSIESISLNGIDAARVVATAKTYNLVDYTDVWGNQEDGYKVNNLARIEESITITDDATDEEIFEYLRDTIGYFLKDTKAEDVRFEWFDDFACEFYAAETEMPLGRLELERR